MPVDEDTLEDRGLRDKFENVTDKIPSGPLGNVGEGDILGAAGYIAVESGEVLTLPIPGLRRPGFQVISHGAEERGEYQRHTININAVSRDVAEFAAKYTAAPSNTDYVRSEIDIHEIEEVTERRTYSTWKITVDVARRGGRLPE